MTKCPKCNANISIKLSNQVKCSACNSDLVVDLSPLGKAIILLIIAIESVASITVAIIAGSVNYPFLQKWMIAGIILLGLIIVTLLLFFWIMNRMASLRVK